MATATATATVTAVDTARGPRFVLEGRIRRNRPVRCVNAMRGQVDELAVYPLTNDSVTEADIQRYFRDTRSTPVPFDLAAQLGTPPLSPGRSAVIEMPLAPGRYAFTSWVTSMKDAQHLLRPRSGAHRHRPLTARDLRLCVNPAAGRTRTATGPGAMLEGRPGAGSRTPSDARPGPRQ
ncbi:hypothetical protein WKI68_06995 [Streptomyces sp. MS1.HAVA.3]|uniref:Uncharacterized protein n=1 Tax=Streptomyces caledonius TaxID=3134107 RepID=A0ABU8U249_9ACTN